jgi:hypothetical protein
MKVQEARIDLYCTAQQDGRNDLKGSGRIPLLPSPGYCYERHVAWLIKAMIKARRSVNQDYRWVIFEPVRS